MCEGAARTRQPRARTVYLQPRASVFKHLPLLPTPRSCRLRPTRTVVDGTPEQLPRLGPALAFTARTARASSPLGRSRASERQRGDPREAERSGARVSRPRALFPLGAAATEAQLLLKSTVLSGGPTPNWSLCRMTSRHSCMCPRGLWGSPPAPRSSSLCPFSPVPALALGSPPPRALALPLPAPAACALSLPSPFPPRSLPLCPSPSLSL